MKKSKKPNPSIRVYKATEKPKRERRQSSPLVDAPEWEEFKTTVPTVAPGYCAELRIPDRYGMTPQAATKFVERWLAKEGLGFAVSRQHREGAEFVIVTNPAHNGKRR